MTTPKDADQIAQIAHRMIWIERQKQLKVKGYDAAHDDEHDDGALALAAASYLLTDFGVSVFTSNVVAGLQNLDGVPLLHLWPWTMTDYKPSTVRLRNLTRAAALIQAEMERELRIEHGLAEPGNAG